MKQIHLHTAAAKDTAAKSHHLAIVFTDDGYSFCTASQAPYHIHELLLSPYPKQWASWGPAEQWDFLKATHPSLNKRYLQVKIAFDSAKPTLLPTAVYKEGTGTDYFELVFGRVQNEQLHRDSLAMLEVDFISAFPMGWQGASQLHFPSARIITVDAAFSLQLARQAALAPGQQLFVRKSTENLSLWAFEGQSLRAFNRFRAISAEDVLYYSLLFTQELGWSGPRLQMSASATAFESISALLRKHFTEVAPFEANKAIAFDPQLSQIDPGSYDLLSACLCVS